MKLCDETSVTSSESLSDLRREVSKFKDAEGYSTKYITDLEARLGRSDESILELQRTVERLEQECERRKEEAEVLQKRLDNLRRDGNSWRSDLEERERKLKDLEERMSQWQKKKNDAGEARTRLGNVVEEVASARRSLEIGLAKTSLPSSPDESGDRDVSPTSHSSLELALESQLASLQQTHTATLADLASISAKYRDALHEISDLAAQIQEARLGNMSTSASDTNDSPIGDKSIDFPPAFRRRITSARAKETADLRLDTRRVLYRQAASTESLHLR
jgi:chromosome segregation ATPase